MLYPGLYEQVINNALTGGQSSFLRFCGKPIRGWL